jgi:hypothetical protein
MTIFLSYVVKVQLICRLRLARKIKIYAHLTDREYYERDVTVYRLVEVYKRFAET